MLEKQLFFFFLFYLLLIRLEGFSLKVQVIDKKYVFFESKKFGLQEWHLPQTRCNAQHFHSFLESHLFFLIIVKVQIFQEGLTIDAIS